ncbi:MAG TPA: hypothetical protein VM659_28645 [Dongiaceae bacterium]|nr:hypothetical protein [Dongiaceae bacterium]
MRRFIGLKHQQDIPSLTPAEMEKFWHRVDRSAGWGCWRWLGGSNGGRPVIVVAGRKFFARRVSWALIRGESIDGLDIRMSCHDSKCVNPWHMSLSTRVETARDNGKLGRAAYGDRAGAAKLTEEQVSRIRRLLAIKLHDFNDLAAMFGVNKETIRAIAKGRTWKRNDQAIDKRAP